MKPPHARAHWTSTRAPKWGVRVCLEWAPYSQKIVWNYIGDVDLSVRRV